RGEARLTAAVRALECGTLADRPHLRRVAPRARRLAAPPRRDPIGMAVGFGRKARLQLCRRLGEITPQILRQCLHHGPTPCWRSCTTRLCLNYGDRYAPQPSGGTRNGGYGSAGPQRRRRGDRSRRGWLIHFYLL